MRYGIVKVWVRIKNLLFGKKSHDFFVFLFFFVVSAGFWLLQTLNETFETEISIPFPADSCYHTGQGNYIVPLHTLYGT